MKTNKSCTSYLPFYVNLKIVIAYDLYSDLSSSPWQLTYTQILATTTSNVIMDSKIIGEEPWTKTHKIYHMVESNHQPRI